jgi:hypothetical protein
MASCAVELKSSGAKLLNDYEDNINEELVHHLNINVRVLIQVE